MSAPLSDEQLRTWAREHLAYEVGMLIYTADRLAERHGEARDRESNALLESFVVHARCLSDFLWRSRADATHEYDAFAEDFCAEGVWERERPAWPPALAEVAERQRPGREIAHLSYRRLDVPLAEKDWQVGRITVEIAAAVDALVEHALDGRLDDDTQDALLQVAGPPPIGHSLIVTAAHTSTTTQAYSYRGGTIEPSDFTFGS